MNIKLIAIPTTCTLMLSLSSVVFSHENSTEEKSDGKPNYTMCAAIRMKEVNLGHIAKNPEKYSTPIPEGWTVVSGTGGDGHPKLLICR